MTTFVLNLVLLLFSVNCLAALLHTSTYTCEIFVIISYHDQITNDRQLKARR